MSASGPESMLETHKHSDPGTCNQFSIYGRHALIASGAIRDGILIQRNARSNLHLQVGNPFPSGATADSHGHCAKGSLTVTMQQATVAVVPASTAPLKVQRCNLQLQLQIQI